MAKDSIEKLASVLAQAVPQGLRSVGDDLEKNFSSLLRSGLNKLDLVTREEFEVQEAVLARTRKNLDAMEARLAELEARLLARSAKQKPATKKPATKKPATRKKTTRK